MNYDLIKLGYVPRALKLGVSAVEFRKFLVDKLIISDEGEPSEPMLAGDYMVIAEDTVYEDTLSVYVTKKGMQYLDKIYKQYIVQVYKANRKKSEA